MVSREELDEYIDTQLWKYETFGNEDPELALHIVKLLGIGLRRLNDVAASDPVWQGTNKKPTIFKLKPYFSSVLANNAEDEEARWILIAVALDACENWFAHELIEPFVVQDTRQIRWLVGAAEWVFLASGRDTTEPLKQSLVRLETLNPFQQKELERISKDADQMVARAACIALAVSDGATIEMCHEKYRLSRA